MFNENAAQLIHITDAGRAALVDTDNTGTAKHRIAEIGLATQAFAFDPLMTTLPHEAKRIATFGGETVAPDTIHVVVQDDSDERYTLFGYGLYLDNGVLFAVQVQAEPIMEKAPQAMMLLAADIQFTTIDATRLVLGPTTFLNPPATTTRKGVVALATPEQARAGTDAERALTSHSTARLFREKADLSGAGFEGPVRIEAQSDDKRAQLAVAPRAGKHGQHAALRLHATFDDAGSKDTGAYLAAAIRAGFAGGAWGREYLDFLLNDGTANTAASDGKQTRALRLTGGRSLVGKIDDDGRTALQVGGDARIAGTHTVGIGAVTLSTAVVGQDAQLRTAGSLSLGTTNATAPLAFVAGQRTHGRLLGSGRWLFGEPSDDGVSRIQSAGPIKGVGTAGALRASNGGGTGATSILLTREGAAPPNRSWEIAHLQTGTLAVRVVNATSNAAQAATGGGPAVAIDGGTLDVTLPNRLIVGPTPDDGASALQVAGRVCVSRATGEGQLALGGNDGYFLGHEKGAGFRSPRHGDFQYVFADRTFRVNDKVVYHQGNIDPLDKTKGGAMAGDLIFATGKRVVLAEGSRDSPSVTFANHKGTGICHTGKDSLDLVNNGKAVLRLTPSLAAFDQPVTSPTPPAGDRSGRLATTEWVLAVISTAAIGQISFEPRTTVRAGFLKANGALVNRTDYPALWAYAQASGALVSDGDWRQNRWGCFSTGDGAKTFRLPELRGEIIRCWDDARGVDAGRTIGSWQDSVNRWHGHGASASAVGDHAHSAWTDANGWHGHGVHDPGHVHPMRNGATPGGDRATVGGPGDTTRQLTETERSPTGINILGEGNHIHNVGVGTAGAHNHTITVSGDGASEARPRNVALLAMIRAF